MTTHRLRFPARSGFLSLFVSITGLLAGNVRAADGSIYYNRFETTGGQPTVRRIGGDGTGDQAFPLNLPSGLYPTISRNGRLLMVTSPDPTRPFKISQNVYVADLTTGGLTRTTSYEDEFVRNGILFTNDLSKVFGDITVSSYKVNFPYHKALSPEGARVVVMNLFKSGAATLGSGVDSMEVLNSSGRLPFVDVYRRSDALPAGAYIFLSALNRDGFNQGGDGVDWHPTKEEVVATVASDIPAVGSAGITSLEGTVIAVFSTQSISPFLRKLTNPVGQVDIVGGNLFYFGVHDYSPSISSDGAKVAYVRHVLRQGISTGYAPFPAQCSIRVVNYDGTGDHQVLALADGTWITKVAWSPDGSKIAFDLAPQAVLNGWNSLLGDVAQSAVHIVNADGSNPHLLVNGAAYPTWGASAPAPVTRPTLQFSRNGAAFQIRVDGLTTGQAFRVEGSTNLLNWGNLLDTQATSPSQLINITPNSQAPSAFYRVIGF